jgi:D-beta-D-heptose 7-phosphate kinase/D-beta-D-heptose 1-phosphate adenosyltransferase
VQCLFLAEPQGRPTTRKTRFIAEGQQLLRIDHEFMDPISEREADAILALTGATPASAILVSDYGKGMITSGMMRRLHGLAREQHAPLLVDPKGTDWQRYGPVDLIKPNAVELAVFAGLPCDSDAQVELALRHALNRSEAAAILVTRAAKGASLLHRDAETAIHFPAREVEVADVCGAGDTNLATLGAMLATGCALPDAVVMAQLASSLAVQRHGNAVITAAELAAEVQPAEASAIDGGVVDEAALAALMRGWRAQGLRVGFTNGCFDILHAGHLRSLEAARSRCDRLVVGLNSDASVRRLKGATRPIVGQRDRAELIAGLGAVDAVVLFDEDTPERLIGSVRPDVLCKGGDYAPGSIVGADLVSSYGGEVVVCDLLPGTSTTSIIDTIRRRFAREAAASIA